MSVNRYNIRINKDQVTETTINIPINLVSIPVDQSELIESKFVEKELEKAVNEIIDYENVRLLPIDDSGVILNGVNYNLTFLNGYTTYGAIGFVQDDLKLRKNNFKRSFLQLDFYDSPDLKSQNFLYSSILYCRVTDKMYNKTTNQLESVNSIDISFELSDPIKNPGGIAEGYYLYDYKSDIPKEIYMRGTFNNAKTGLSHGFMIKKEKQNIEDLVNNIHTKYILKRNNEGFYYQLDTTYPNIDIKNGIGTISLYEIQVL